MSKGQKIFISVVAVLVVAALIVWGVIAYKKRKADEANKTLPCSTSGNGANVQNSTQSSGSNSAQVATTFTTRTPAFEDLPLGQLPIKKGSKNKYTWLYQYYLDIMHGAGLELDGNWGTKTETASVKYLNASVIDKTKLKSIINSVPANKVAYFKEYADIVKTLL